MASSLIRVARRAPLATALAVPSASVGALWSDPWGGRGPTRHHVRVWDFMSGGWGPQEGARCRRGLKLTILTGRAVIVPGA
jgi:hypothetical protein